MKEKVMTETRICILMLKYLFEHGKGERTEDTIINELTEDDFERWFIPLATYWSNDIIDLCFDQLGIEQPKGTNSHVVDDRDTWYAWFEKTVTELKLS